jgi:uncharacterized protein
MTDEKIFPNGLIPMGDRAFSFSCHPGVPCFTLCCRNVDMILYPYDIIRLKQAIHVDSQEFLQKYARIVSGDNPYFPTVMMRMTDNSEPSCPFLSENGCAVYQDRPSACRTYPLERAVDRTPQKGGADEFYFLTSHEYCKGHTEQKVYSARQYVRGQFLEEYNIYNDLWAQVDTIFRTNPWKGEGMAGSLQQMAFMVCYDIDGFRKFSQEKRLLDQFKLPKDLRRRICFEDSELLKFGFEWLKLFFTGKSSLVK